MYHRLQEVAKHPPEISKLDARIAEHGGTSSRLEMLPDRLQKSKVAMPQGYQQQLDALIRENGYLRQEISYHEESRSAMLHFHNQVLEAHRNLQAALDELKKNVARAEGRILRFWGVENVNAGKDEIITL